MRFCMGLRAAGLLSLVFAAALDSLSAAAQSADRTADQTPAQTTAGGNQAELLLQPCPTPTAACEVSLSRPSTLILHNLAKVPRGRTLRILPGGSLTLRSGTLDFGGASVNAPSAAQIFLGDGHVRGLALARPDWFAAPGLDGAFPSAALALAYLATIPYGTLEFNASVYISPFGASSVATPNSPAPGSPPFLLSSPRTLLGAGRPHPDSNIAPTRLIGGTVLAGEVRGTAAIQVAHLGIDDGPAVAARYFGGVRRFGLVLGGDHSAHGTRLLDLAVLTTGVRDQHSVIIEGQHDLRIDDLFLWTLGGTHGLVLKSDHSTVHGFHCRGASSDCLIVKSDQATDGAGYAAFNTLSEIDIHFLQNPGDTGGIVVDSRWDRVHDITFTNVQEQGTRYGFDIGGSWLHHAHALHIFGWKATDIRGFCFLAYHAEGIWADHFQCTWRAPSPVPAFILEGSDVHLSNGTIAQSTPMLPPSVAIEDRGSGTVLSNLRGFDMSGFLLQSAHPPSLAALAADHVTAAPSEQLLAPFPPPPRPWRERIARWRVQAKRTGRILWTMAWYHGRAVATIALMSVLLLGVTFHFFRPFMRTRRLTRAPFRRSSERVRH